jgi:hypothetical protein
MANIGQDTNAMPTGGKEVNRLFNAVQNDLTAIRAEVVKLVTDIATHRTEVNKIRAGLVNITMQSAAIAIATTKTKIKTVTDPIAYLIDGVFYSKAATDNFWVLTGFTCTNALYNKCLLCIDASGNMQIAAGTEAATANAVTLPTIPASYAVVGVVQVHPTGTGNFTGGTTELDDATVVPNATYTNLAFHASTLAALAAGTAANPAALTLTE